MPTIDIELVCRSPADFERLKPSALADALGRALSSAPGHTWVKLRFLSKEAYAENEAVMDDADLPAFVTILHAHLPGEDMLSAEARVITQVVAQCVGRAAQRVHVQYAPAGAGRQAFGGEWLR